MILYFLKIILKLLKTCIDLFVSFLKQFDAYNLREVNAKIENKNLGLVRRMHLTKENL